MATLSSSGRTVRFENFELDLQHCELRRDGNLVKLQPQPAKVLALLVSRRGEVVSRNEIAEKVWGAETFVDFERGLNFAVSQIRVALGDAADQPRFVETVPKRGYRFVAEVRGPSDRQEVPAATTPSPGGGGYTKAVIATAIVSVLLLAGIAGYLWTTRKKAQSGQPQVVLAVLPFDDLSSEPEPFLSDSLTEEMVVRVAQINPQHLKVIARTSAMQYQRTKKNARQIGEELKADYILENSIRHESGRLRVTSQLVRTADQTHLWAENYDRDVRELLPLEGEIAADIAEQIQHELFPTMAVSHPKHPVVDSGAHELYLKGRYSLNQRTRENLQEAVSYFQQAVAKQPDYAAAYAGLADTYNLIAFYGFGPTMSTVGEAKASALKALKLEDSMAAAHASLAYSEFMWQGDWSRAEREFQRALELDDNYVPAHHWYALYLAAVGRTGESLNQMRYAQKLDPFSPSVHAGLAYMYYLARDYDQAVQQSNLALELNANSMAAHAVLGWTFTEQKKYPEATEQLRTAVALSGGVPVYQCALARAYALSGNVREARKVLQEVEVKQHEALGAGSALAATYLALGDSERALHWLEQTAPGDIQANWLRVDPAFDALRQNQRLLAVISRIGSVNEQATVRE